MKISFLTLVLLLNLCTAYSQNIGLEIIGVHTNQFGLVTKDTLKGAQTLKDIFSRYDSSWVESYISVELFSNCKDENKRAVGKNDTLTEEQLSLLNGIDVCCQLNVKVDYIPKNKLENNPPRQMNFTLNIAPIIQAKFPGGPQNMNDYLKENTLDKLDLEDLELATVRFVIDENGEVSNAEITKGSLNNHVDELLLDAICKMPKWEPALNPRGVKIQQDFEFNIGTSLLNGC